MRRVLLFFIFVFTLSALQAQSLKRIQNIITQAEHDTLLANAQWSLYAVYLKSGKVLIDHHSQFALAPASGQKILTTGTALMKLGKNFRFTTRLFYEGTVDHGTLQGNVYLVGGGDPTLGSDQVPGSPGLDSLMSQWLTAFRQAGIRRINGTIFGDDLLFADRTIPDNWVWVDMGNYYGASSPALTIQNNYYRLIFAPGKHKGDPTEILGTEPPIPGLTFVNQVKTGAKGSGDNGYIYCAPGQFNAYVTGTVPAGPNRFAIKGAIPAPTLFAAQYLRRYLIAHGIAVAQPARRLTVPKDYSHATLLLKHLSPPLKDIVYQTNKRSINLYCELLAKQLSMQSGGPGTTKDGVRIIKQNLIAMGVPVEGLHLSDGSGLSRTNTVTTRLMVAYLRQMSKQPCFNTFYNSLAVTGDPNDIGYFKNWGKGTPLAFNAHMKSGLIERVRSHSGYLKDRSGRWIVFSFIVNNFDGSYKLVDKIHEHLLIELSKQR